LRSPRPSPPAPRAKLKRWAKDGQRPDGYEALRPLVEKIGDPFVVGRRAAAIPVALEHVRG